MSLPIIDPNALMNALTPALKENGGLGGPTQACRVISILRDTKKLISKAVYLTVFQQDTPEATEAFTYNGGWELLHVWLVEAHELKLYHYMKEMVKVYKLLPINIDLLKMNSTAKIIKQLSKNPDAPEDVRSCAADLASQWLKLVTSSKLAATDTETAAASSTNDVNKKLKKKQTEDKKRRNSSESSDLLSSTKTSSKRTDKTKSSSSRSVKAANNDSDSDYSPDVKDKPASKQTSSRSELKKSRDGGSVKTYKTQFRKTGLETNDAPEKKKLKVDIKAKDVTDPEKKKTISPLPSSSSGKSLVDTILNLNEKKKKDSPTSTAPSGGQGKIKLIPPKPKPIAMVDSNAFMNSLDAARLPPVKRVAKKKPVPEKKVPSVLTPTSPLTPTTPNTPSLSNPSTTQAAVVENGSTEVTPNEDDAVTVPAVVETSTEEKVVEKVIKPDNGTPTGSILVTNHRRKVTKTIKWADNDKLTSTFYFELDETERVNVNHLQFESMKQKEMMRERAMLKNKHQFDDEDSSAAQTKWRSLHELDSETITIFDGFGSSSTEKEKEAARQSTVLQSLYLTKESIPYTPTEPDYEDYEKTTPLDIPLTCAVSETTESPSSTSSTQPTMADVMNFLSQMNTDSSSSGTAKVDEQQPQQQPVSVPYGVNPAAPYPMDPNTNYMYPQQYPGYYDYSGMQMPPGMPMGINVPPPPLPPTDGSLPVAAAQTNYHPSNHNNYNPRFHGSGPYRPKSFSDQPRRPPPYAKKGGTGTVVCRHFMSHGCAMENRCRFLHPTANGGPSKTGKK